MSESWAVEITEIALDDMREAVMYMRDALKSSQAAECFLEPFFEVADSLKTYPERRPLVRDFELARRGYRWCSVGNFMLFFTADGEARHVVVERVLYGASDWKTLVDDGDRPVA